VRYEIFLSEYLTRDDGLAHRNFMLFLFIPYKDIIFFEQSFLYNSVGFCQSR